MADSEQIAYVEARTSDLCQLAALAGNLRDALIGAGIHSTLADELVVIWFEDELTCYSPSSAYEDDDE